jgi:hypothetical protein
MSPVWIVYLLPLAAASYYAIRCAWWPLKRCRRCKGEGTHRRPLKRSRTMLCRRCRGGGQSVRLGRIVVDRIRTTRTRERAAS